MKKKQLNKSKIKQNQEKEWEWDFLTNTNSKQFSNSETHILTQSVPTYTCIKLVIGLFFTK